MAEKCSIQTMEVAKEAEFTGERTMEIDRGSVVSTVKTLKKERRE